MELSAGDRVVYPNQGVCRVTGIEEQEVAGQKLLFVTMQREEDGARVLVPKAKLESIGVRKISSPDDVKKIFSFLQADTEKADLDWKQRARTNLDRMTAGGLMGLAEVVKGLQVLSELRPLPTKERELYDDARHLLVSEIAASLAIPDKNAEDAVDVALFPPGKERPKRTAEEFKRVGDDEDLDLGEDLLAVGGDLDLPTEEEPAEPEEAAEEAAPDEEAAADTEAAEEAEPAPQKKRGRPPKAKPAEPPAEAAAAPKKRGRPAKAKPAQHAAPPAKKRATASAKKPAKAAKAASGGKKKK